MEIDHTEGIKCNIITLETNYNNLLNRVNVLGETSIYYSGLIPELEYEIHNISMHIRSIERYQNEIKGGITVNDKLSMLPDNIQKLITKEPLVTFVIDPVLMEIQKDTMISLISEYQRLILFLEKKTKATNEQLLTAEQVQKDTDEKIENIDPQTGIDIELLKYLSDNFKGGKTPLTKYNQIYRYFNEDRDINITQIAYKNLIMELFKFDYANSYITREVKKHMDTLKNLAIYYRDSKK